MLMMEERVMEERGIRPMETLIKEPAEGGSGWSSCAVFPSNPPWATGNERQQDWTNNGLTNKPTNWCKNTGSGEPLLPAGTAGIPPSARLPHNPVHQLQLNRSSSIIWAQRRRDRPVYIFIMFALCHYWHLIRIWMLVVLQICCCGNTVLVVYWLLLQPA